MKLQNVTPKNLVNFGKPNTKTAGVVENVRKVKRVYKLIFFVYSHMVKFHQIPPESHHFHLKLFLVYPSLLYDAQMVISKIIIFGHKWSVTKSFVPKSVLYVVNYILLIQTTQQQFRHNQKFIVCEFANRTSKAIIFSRLNVSDESKYVFRFTLMAF